MLYDKHVQSMSNLGNQNTVDLYNKIGNCDNRFTVYTGKYISSHKLVILNISNTDLYAPDESICKDLCFNQDTCK